MTPAHPPSLPVTLPTPEQLPDDVATLKNMLIEALLTLQERERDNEHLRHRLDLLLRRVFGPRSERFSPDQLVFAFLAETGIPAEPPAAEPPAPASLETPPPPAPRRRCRPHGRRRLPEDLPRQEVHHTLPEAARICSDCGQVRNDIGVDRSEMLEYCPATLRVVAHLVHKYVCGCAGALPALRPQTAVRAEETQAMPTPDTEARPASPEPAAAPVIIRASKPPAPLPKGLPGPGLLAHLIVSKYADHLPLYRLERIYERQGVFLPRSTLSDWLAACADLLQPVYGRLTALVLQSRALHTDDTPVKLQDPTTRSLSTARLWVYLGDRTHPYNVFDFTPTHQRDGPERFLAGFAGYLHADAFKGYDRLYLPAARPGQKAIIEVACNAHARRKFYEARTSDSVRAHQALGYYRMLYALERPAADFEDEGRWRMRQEIAVPILEKFHGWLEAEKPKVLPKSPMGEAMAYALNNWNALIRYTEQGFLDIDNNAAEREMKRIAIGRKNWLFVGSEKGGQTAAVLFSLTSTCQRLGIEPWAYLQDVLTRLPSTPGERLDELLPDRWEVARRARAKTDSPAPSSAPGATGTPSPG
jgi:transposase